jgi:hypothetical protein
MWPLIQANITDREHRVEFTGKLLRLFVHDDMDPYDVEDVHHDVRAAMRDVGIEIAEPDRYRDDKYARRMTSRRRAVFIAQRGTLP